MGLHLRAPPAWRKKFDVFFRFLSVALLNARVVLCRTSPAIKAVEHETLLTSLDRKKGLYKPSCAHFVSVIFYHT